MNTAGRTLCVYMRACAFVCACACACTFTTLCNAHLRGVVEEVSWEILMFGPNFTYYGPRVCLSRPRPVSRGLPRFIKGLYWAAGLFLRTPFTEGCVGANKKALPPGRQQEQASKQLCTFSPTTFSSVQVRSHPVTVTLDARGYLAWASLGFFFFFQSLHSKFRSQELIIAPQPHLADGKTSQDPLRSVQFKRSVRFSVCVVVHVLHLAAACSIATTSNTDKLMHAMRSPRRQPRLEDLLEVQVGSLLLRRLPGMFLLRQVAYLYDWYERRLTAKKAAKVVVY